MPGMEDFLQELRENIDVDSLDRCDDIESVINWVKIHNKDFEYCANQVSDTIEMMNTLNKTLNKTLTGFTKDFKSCVNQVSYIIETMNALNDTLRGFTKDDVTTDMVKLSSRFARLATELRMLFRGVTDADMILRVIENVSSLLIRDHGKVGTRDDGELVNTVAWFSRNLSSERKLLFGARVQDVLGAAREVLQCTGIVISKVWDKTKYHDPWLKTQAHVFLRKPNYKSATDDGKKIEIWTNLKSAIEPTLKHLEKDKRVCDFYKKLLKIYNELESKIK